MNGSEHYRGLERLYLGAPVNAPLLPELEIRVDEGGATIRFAIKSEMHHAAHAMHGSYYFKALDDAAFFAANSMVQDVFVLTASFNIHLLRPITSGAARAEGKVVRAGRTLIYADSVLFDPEGRELGTGSGVFARSKVVLAELNGYAPPAQPADTQ